jgi:transposase-like protein
MIQPTKQVKWRSLISEQQQSGQTAAAFCRDRALDRSQFYYWKKRLREGEEGMTPPFVEVQVAKPRLRPKPSPSALGSMIEVRLSNGRSLIVAPEFDARHLRAVLAVVESAS